MSNGDLVETRLLQLKERFMAASPQRIEALANAIARFEHDQATAPELSRQFHSLAGTAGTYGLVAVSALAREGEDICCLLDADAPGYLRTLVETMRYSEAA